MVGVDVLRVALDESREARRVELYPHGVHDLGRDLVLNVEDVSSVPIVFFGPDLVAVGDLDEADRDAQTLARGAHASFEDVVDAERGADLAYVLGAFFEAKRRRPRRDAQARDARESVDDFLRHALAEVVLVSRGA